MKARKVRTINIAGRGHLIINVGRDAIVTVYNRAPGDEGEPRPGGVPAELRSVKRRRGRKA
jgi:hypothetical protein